MPKNTSISLGEHFDTFVAEQLKSGRYSSTSEVVRGKGTQHGAQPNRLAVIGENKRNGHQSDHANQAHDEGHGSTFGS